MNSVEKQTLELFPEMKKQWGNKLNRALRSIKFSQTEDAAVVDLLFQNEQGETTTETTNLDFISGEELDELLFKPDNDVVDNAKCFVELDGYSLINCIGNLFEDKAADEINDEHQRSIAFKSK